MPTVKEPPEKPSIAHRLALAAESIAALQPGGINSHFASPYVTLPQCLAAVKTALQSQGLILMQPISSDGMNVKVFNSFIDREDGTQLNFETLWPIPGPEAHIVASAVTYASRISLMRLFAIPMADDDGNGASPGAADRAKAQRQTRQPARETLTPPPVPAKGSVPPFEVDERNPLPDPNAQAQLAAEKRRPGRPPKAEAPAPAVDDRRVVGPDGQTGVSTVPVTPGVSVPAENVILDPPKPLSDVTSLEATAPGARKPVEAPTAPAPAPETPKAPEVASTPAVVEPPKTEVSAENDQNSPEDEAWLGLCLPAQMMDHVPQGGLEWRKRYGMRRVDEISIKGEWDVKGIKWMLLHRPGGAKHPTLAMQPDHVQAWAAVQRLAKELSLK